MTNGGYLTSPAVGPSSHFGASLGFFLVAGALKVTFGEGEFAGEGDEEEVAV